MNHNKRLASIGFTVVILQIFLLLLPIIRPGLGISTNDFYGSQSITQVLADYEMIIMIPELREEWLQVSLSLCCIATLFTLGLLISAFLSTVFAAADEQGTEHKLSLLRNASCFLAAIPLVNCFFVFFINNWDAATFPTLFGFLLMAAPLSFIPLYKNLVSDFPETPQKSSDTPNWKHFLPEDE